MLEEVKARQNAQTPMQNLTPGGAGGLLGTQTAAGGGLLSKFLGIGASSLDQKTINNYQTCLTYHKCY